MSENPAEQLSPSEPLPWEEPRRQKLAALVDTVKLVLLHPREAFRRMNRKLPASRALLFALAVAWPSLTLGCLVALLLQLGELAVASAFFEETRTAWAVLTPFLLACACLVLFLLFVAGSAVVKALGGP